MNSTPELSPGALMLKRVDEQFFKFEEFLNLIASLTILAVMFIGVFQVFGRKFLNYPVPGYVDVIELTMAIFAFVAISYCQRLGGHVRMEIILGRFKGRLLYTFEILASVVAIIVIMILIYYSYEHFLRAWTIGDSTIDIDLPIWPAKLLVPSALSVLLVRLFIQLVGFIRLFMSPDAVPIGIPQIETVDEQAQHEIDAGLAGEEEKVDLLHRDKSEETTT